MSRVWNVGRSHNIKIENSSFERVEEFKYLGTTITNQNSIQEEIKSRLKSGNACYYAMQNLLSSSVLPKNLKIKIYSTIILPVVLYGCETWLLTLSNECGLRMFKNWVMRRMFVPKWNRGVEKLQNEELNDLYFSSNIVRVIKSRMGWVGHVACMGERRGIYRVLVGKPEGKRPLRRTMHRWEDNI